MRKETRSRSTRPRAPNPRVRADGHRRWRLTLAYDGSAFSGWQFLGNGKSVQEHLEAALATIVKSTDRLPIHGSGRTDAGVHALAQTVHFDAPAALTLDGPAWVRAFNVLIPHQMRVLDARPADPSFHARYDACGKHYRYRLFTGPILPPHEYGRAAHWPHALNPAVMREAAAAFLGEHDFSAFAAYRNDGTDQTHGSGRNIRHIRRADITADGPWITFDFAGSGFLYRMVRLMTGALIKTGAGRLSPADIPALLNGRLAPDGRFEKSPLCAAAEGLYLVEVFYPEPDAKPDHPSSDNSAEAMPR